MELAPAMISQLLEVIHNALLVTSADNRIIFANSQTYAMFAATPEFLLGQDISVLFMEEDADILVANILFITRTEKEIESEAMFQRRDGGIFLGRISGAWFRWDEGQEGMAFSIHDISDVKTIEHSFKQAEQEAYLGRLINDINHQIINPVMAIGGFARRLQGECGNSHHPQVILSEALRLEKLLNTISRFTRLPRPKSERVLFSQLVSEIDSRIGSQVRGNGCKWQCSCTVEHLNKKLHVDRERLFEALADIAENGCESYSLLPDTKEKLVTCEIVARDDIAFPYRIKITDHGCGIAAETLPHVFSHFFSEKTGHVGMGLTFTRRIIEEQGGRVEIQSEPGCGTSVSIYLVKERRRALRTERMC